jgi:uncharacterized membrane protein YeaQ/YmgE (transglycosylase-associated protein family)
MDLLTWIIVGLIAGLLASLVAGGSGYGLLGDIVVGMVGALVGGWLWREARWRAPADGLVGTIIIAFVGAVILLVLLHVIQRARLGRPPR